MFQHLVFRSSNLLAGGKKGRAGAIIKAQLLEAISRQEVIGILEGETGLDQMNMTVS
jgi:hypothetical protein